MTADYVYIKLDENNPGIADDRTIQGINLGTRFDAWNGELEAYYLNKRDKNGVTPNIDKDGSESTIGIRGSVQPADGASVYSELAYQFGRRAPSYDGESATNGVRVGDALQAWAFDLGLDFTFKDVPTSPKIGAEWIYYSGQDIAGGGGTANTGWSPIAPSYFPTLLRSFQTRSTAAGLYPVDQTGVTSAFTNQSEIALYGSLKPIEDLTVGQRLSLFWSAEPITPVFSGGTTPKRQSFLGTEWDTRVAYAYTDDVTLGVDYGIFFPGTVFHHASLAASGQDRAQELVTSVSVKF